MTMMSPEFCFGGSQRIKRPHRNLLFGILEVRFNKNIVEKHLNKTKDVAIVRDKKDFGDAFSKIAKKHNITYSRL